MAKREYLGKTEQEVILYLAENPEQNITTIQQGLGKTNHSAVAKAVNNLKSKRLVIKIRSYKAKGRKVPLWGLTEKGAGESINLGADFYGVLEKHSKYYKEFKFLMKVNTIIENHIPAWKVEGSSVYKKMMGLMSRLDEDGMGVQTAAALAVLGEWMDKKGSENQRLGVMKEILRLPMVKKEAKKIDYMPSLLRN